MQRRTIFVLLLGLRGYSEIWAACSWQNRESREHGEWADISTREIEGKLFGRKSVSYVHGSVYKPTFTPGSSLLSRISDFIPWNRVCVLFQLTVVFSNFRRLMCAQYPPYANVCIVDTYHQLSPSHPLTMLYRLYRHSHVPSLCFPFHLPFPFPFRLALCQSSVQQHICTYVVYNRLQPDIFGAAPPVSKVHDFWGDRLTALRDNRRCLLTSLRFSNFHASIELLFFSGYFGLECHCLDVFLGSHDFFSSFFITYVLHMDTYRLPTNLAEM